MTHDNLSTAELLIAATHCSYHKIREECLDLLLQRDFVPWEVARNMPLLDKMVFPESLSAEVPAAFLSIAFAAAEDAVAGLRFAELAGLLADRSFPRQVRAHFSGRLQAVAGGAVFAEPPDAADLMCIALRPDMEDHHRIVAAGKAMSAIGDPLRGLGDDSFIEPPHARRIVFLLSDDLPVEASFPPAEARRALGLLLGAMEMYALCGSFRSLFSFAMDASVPEAVRARAVGLFGKSAAALSSRATMQVDDEVILELLSASRSPWLGPESRFEAAELLAHRADMVAEVSFTGIVKESFRPPPPHDSQTRLKALEEAMEPPSGGAGLAAFTRLVDDMRAEKSPVPRKRIRKRSG